MDAQHTALAFDGPSHGSTSAARPGRLANGDPVEPGNRHRVHRRDLRTTAEGRGEVMPRVAYKWRLGWWAMTMIVGVVACFLG
jgi:hypothetical protein